MADIFDVLSDDNRRQILVLLRQFARGLDSAPVEASVSEIVAATGLSQPTVSKQLKVLRDAHVVTVREDGQHRLYRLNVDPLRSAEAWLSEFLPRETGTQEMLRRRARDFGGALAEFAAKAPWR
ncbi:MAG: ArsR family transcriptional regulator [Microbacteriaceae bacterium]|nr:ArsR family transcriptional regulator [Microbacteriaceae bacterium]